MFDTHSDQTVMSVITNAVLSADNTPATIDLLGYGAAELVLAIGAGGITFSTTNKVEFVLTHSDDDVTYTAVEDKDMLGVSSITGGIIKTLNAAYAGGVSRFGYKGSKRYLKLLADFSGTHGTGTPIAAVIIASHGHDNPQADQA